MPHGHFNLTVDGANVEDCESFIKELEDYAHNMCEDFGVGVDDLQMSVSWGYPGQSKEL